MYRKHTVRYEFKYKIPNFRLHDLRAMIHPFVQLDRHAFDSPDHVYTVRSIYFETPDFEMYHSKKEHLANRQKVRIRGYNTGNDETTVFLEIKRKYEGPIQKNRYSVAYGTVKKMFDGGSFDALFPETVKSDNARRFFFQIYSRNLRPVVNVVYEREPFFTKNLDPINDCRLTIDFNWRSAAYPGVDELFDDTHMSYCLDGFFVLEVKFNQYCPHWIKPILASLDTQRGPASKYVTCIDANPSIHPNRSKSLHFSIPFLKHPVTC
jgi:hypothetical protein